jgi:hypothetical protein
MNATRSSRKSDWTLGQRKMMRKARWFHAGRGLLLVACLALLTWAGWEGFGRLNAHALCRRLLDADTKEVPAVVADMRPYRRWLNPLLREAYAEAAAKQDSRRQLHASLALLSVDDGQVEYLSERLLAADPEEVSVIRGALLPHKHLLIDRLWGVANSPVRQEQRFLCAASALAAYAPDDPRWKSISGAVAEEMARVSSFFLKYWVEALRPVRLNLLEPLRAVAGDARRREAERYLVTEVLADYAADRPELLADLLLDADETQFAVLFPKVEAGQERALAAIQETLAQDLGAQGTDADKERLAKRQANAAAALFRLKQPNKVWPV